MDIANGKIEEESQPALIIISEDSEQPALAIEAEAPAAEEVKIKTFDPKGEEGAIEVPPAKVSAKAAKAAAKPAPVVEPIAAVAEPAPLPTPEPILAEEMPKRRAKPSLRQYIPLAAVSLAVFASSVSAIGVLMASRMIAETNSVLHEVSLHQAKVRRMDALINEIDGLRDREQIALVRLEQINSGKPATGREVRGAITGLQMALAKYQPGGANGTITLLRDGQSELAERVSTMYRRVEKIDEKLDRLISSNPKAKRAGDPKPPS